MQSNENGIADFGPQADTISYAYEDPKDRLNTEGTEFITVGKQLNFIKGAQNNGTQSIVDYDRSRQCRYKKSLTFQFQGATPDPITFTTSNQTWVKGYTAHIEIPGRITATLCATSEQALNNAIEIQLDISGWPPATQIFDAIVPNEETIYDVDALQYSVATNNVILNFGRAVDSTQSKLSYQSENATSKSLKCDLTTPVNNTLQCTTSWFKTAQDTKNYINAEITEFFSTKHYSLHTLTDHQSPSINIELPSENIIQAQFITGDNSFNWTATENNEFDYTSLQLESLSRGLTINLIAAANVRNLVMPDLPADYQVDPQLAARRITLTDFPLSQPVSISEFAQTDLAVSPKEHFSATNNIDLNTAKGTAQAQNFSIRFMDNSIIPNKPIAGVRAWVYARDDVTVLKEAVTDESGIAEFGIMPAQISFAYQIPRKQSTAFTSIMYEKGVANTGVIDYTIRAAEPDCLNNAEQITLIAKSSFGTIERISNFNIDEISLYPIDPPVFNVSGEYTQQFIACGLTQNKVPANLTTSLQAKIGDEIYSGQPIKSNTQDNVYRINFDEISAHHQINYTFINKPANVEPRSVDGWGKVVSDKFNFDSFFSLTPQSFNNFSIWTPKSLLQITSQNFNLTANLGKTAFRYIGYYKNLDSLDNNRLALIPFNSFNSAAFDPTARTFNWQTYLNDNFTFGYIYTQFDAAKLELTLRFPPNDKQIVIPALPLDYKLTQNSSPDYTWISLSHQLDEPMESKPETSPFTRYYEQLRKQRSYEIEISIPPLNQL